VKFPILYIVVFLCGASVMVVEIAGGRALYPYLGNTIYTWSGVIAVVMAALSIGYWAGGRLGDRYADAKHLSYIIFFAGLATMFAPLLTSIGGAVSYGMDIALASVFAPLSLVPASLFYGMVAPYAVRLASRKGKVGANAGNVFALSTVGSITGVLAAGFLLIPNMGLSHVFLFTSFAMLACSLALHLDRKRVFDAIVYVALLILMGTFSFSPVFGDTLYQKNSEYALITVVEKEGVKTLFIDNVASSAERDGEPVFGYVLVSARAFEIAPNPERGLVLGSAAGTQVEMLKREYPQIIVDAVDIDPLTVKIGREYFSFRDDERTNVHIEDARRFVSGREDEYGIVLIDAFKSHAPPPHLLSVEFVRAVKRSMKDDGVVAVNIIARLEHGGYLGNVHDTYASVFGNVYVFPSGGRGEVQNIVIIATDASRPEFEEKYAGEMYGMGHIGRIITDERNPVEVFADYR